MGWILNVRQSLLKKYLCRSLSGMERIWMKF